ncbi:MAG: bifunctional hydroxymethylpyrimidine kinase/phosphomethylpyrimidine kinase [Planctomycetota bacterium]
MNLSLADQLWRADSDLADACLVHPFVRGLADGCLPPWRYRDYVAQDAFFLRAFGEAYELAGKAAVDSADDAAEDADGRALYQRLREGIDEELQLHRAMAQRLDIDLETVQPTAATLGYTDFLLATAARRPEPCIAAAMLPCLRLYAWLGQQLLPRLDADSPWADWVRTYADPGFDALWRQLAPRLESESVGGEELARTHRRAMELELRFFDSAWRGEGGASGCSMANERSTRLALTIAGSDPSGGAGIQADLKTFHRFGVYGQSVLTLLTAQNTRGVDRVHIEPADVVEAQLHSVLADLGADAIKTGALGTAENVACVARCLAEHQGADRRSRKLVVDPVLVSKHGHDLAAPDVADALHQHLLPQALLVTPNGHEAHRLTGIDVTSEATAERAARALIERSAAQAAVLVKDVPTLDGDLLVTAEGSQTIPSPRIDSPHRHGSGCTFSAAVTACLANGLPLEAAIQQATDFTNRAIHSAPMLGTTGPLNHWA